MIQGSASSDEGTNFASYISQREKEQVTTMAETEVKCVDVDDEDFGYPLTEEETKHIPSQKVGKPQKVMPKG